MHLQSCKTCGNCNINFYNIENNSQNIGFCLRFKEVINLNDNDCILYEKDLKKVERYKEQHLIKKLKLEFKQLTFDL